CKLMFKLMFLASIAPIVAALCLCVSTLKWASACPGANTCGLTGNATEHFNNDNPRTAAFRINAQWHCIGTPFLGATEVASGNTTVTNVNYDPAYFFPSACDTTSGVDITVTCQMGGTCSDPHTLNTMLNVGPTPNNCTTTLAQTINCP